MSDAQDWFAEARLRLEDAHSLLGRGRSSRAISAAYYAVHAAGKSALLTVHIEINSHTALYKLLSRHFVRSEQLSDRTASLIQQLHEKRLAADYDLEFYEAAETRARLSDAEALIDQIEALI